MDFTHVFKMDYTAVIVSEVEIFHIEHNGESMYDSCYQLMNLIW